AGGHRLQPDEGTGSLGCRAAAFRVWHRRHAQFGGQSPQRTGGGVAGPATTGKVHPSHATATTARQGQGASGAAQRLPEPASGEERSVGKDGTTRRRQADRTVI